MMKRPAFPVRTRIRPRRFYHATRVASIRYASLFGSVVAFVLLCVVSARAATMLEPGGGARAEVVNIARPTVALGVRDATIAQALPAPDARLQGEDVDAANGAEEISAGEHAVVQDQVARAAGLATIVGQRSAVLPFLLLILTITALGGWCRTRALLKRVAASARAAESEWQRRCAAVEVREQAARVVVASLAPVATHLERDQVHAAMRHFVGGPLAALASLLDALNEATLPSQRPLVSKIQSAVRTWACVLEDVIASTSVQSRTVVLDETWTDVRTLIDGVAALFVPIAAQKGVCLNIHVDQSVDARVFADGARFGQIIFHLLSGAVWTTDRGEITVAARAETLNAGSQRIFVSVTVAAPGTPTPSRCSVQMRWPSLFDAAAPEGVSLDEEASSLALCQQLTQYMRGELEVSREAGLGTCSMFSAPFAIEHPQTLGAPRRVNLQATPRATVADTLEGSSIPLAEPFDRSYLDALVNEGIDLRTFICRWRQSVDDDLRQMRGLRIGHDMDATRALLHRLSGAVGLVGAHSLTEALQLASVAQPESTGPTLADLEKRIAALTTQLDTAIQPHRSNLQ